MCVFPLRELFGEALGAKMASRKHKWRQVGHNMGQTKNRVPNVEGPHLRMLRARDAPGHAGQGAHPGTLRARFTLRAVAATCALEPGFWLYNRLETPRALRARLVSFPSESLKSRAQSERYPIRLKEVKRHQEACTSHKPVWIAPKNYKKCSN